MRTARKAKHNYALRAVQERRKGVPDLGPAGLGLGFGHGSAASEPQAATPARGLTEFGNTPPFESYRKPSSWLAVPQKI